MEPCVNDVLENHEFVKRFLEAPPGKVNSKLLLDLHDSVLLCVLLLLLRYNLLHLSKSPLQVILGIKVTFNLFLPDLLHCNLHLPVTLNCDGCLIGLLKHKVFKFSSPHLFFILGLNMLRNQHFFKL